MYHIKTLKHYSLSYTYKELNDGFLWIGNLLFAISIFLLACFMLYTIYSILESDFGLEILYVLIFSVIVLLIGVILILEERLLYKKHIILKKQYRIRKIEDIVGRKDD